MQRGHCWAPSSDRYQRSKGKPEKRRLLLILDMHQRHTLEPPQSEGCGWWLGLLMLLLFLMSAAAWHQRPTEPAFHRMHRCQWRRQRGVARDPSIESGGDDDEELTRSEGMRGPVTPQARPRPPPRTRR